MFSWVLMRKSLKKWSIWPGKSLLLIWEGILTSVNISTWRFKSEKLLKVIKFFNILTGKAAGSQEELQFTEEWQGNGRKRIQW